MDLDLRLVRYFVTVADELHFGRAAAKLFISQPTLSKQIRKLETDVGGALLVRDSRHVALTPRGDRFLHLARQLLATADQMLREPAPHHLRIAHIFELDTSRLVADAYLAAHPAIRLVQSQMDSARQLRALLEGHPDVAIVRVTGAMKAAHPAGWQHRLLRLEPFRLVGRPGDPRRPAVSVHERPIEVFADAPGTALYNVHGRYLSSLEQHTGLALRWLGNPGTFDTCHAALTRAPDSAYLLEFESYARRYEDLGIPAYRPQELQPVYPWSLAWRDGERPETVRGFLEVAGQLAARLRWLHPERADGVPLWAPPEDLAVA
ncbi:LysR family transcriptional regulator [Amycolatopsis sp. DG1A-15b]|uniref:LysR family transcriptional regulator n=1 Tax=Amycolatopsis sp. DG1A-15b TaxID=3052846 RepID=UPI00255BAC4F|nr:LysR family transcriptional regulator [Amycolatopsis sp. DG1A-15b]WIX90603.1 LysR family transcriptional regulator [Amycolatopsis sp. DG1A-15b]